MRAVLLTAGLVAVMGLITGCSSKCESVCSNANSCDLSQRAVDVDCPSFCSDVDAFDARVKAAGQDSCDSQFQAHLDCWEKNSGQICSTDFDGCKDSGQAWTDCMKTYCAAVAAAKQTDPNCSKGKPTLAPF